MASDKVLSAASVREYFVKNGGRVKRDDLFDYFRGQFDKSEDQGTSNNRFGDIINSLAFLQNIEGEKYFKLKTATPVVQRRLPRQVNQRKDKGLSLPASMRSFRLSAAEDASGKLAIPNGRSRASFSIRSRAWLRSESHDVGMRRYNADIENAQANDSGVDTAVSSLQSESPGVSRQSSLSKNSEYDQMSLNSSDTGIFIVDDYYEYDSPSHVLSPFEKSWMMSAIKGNKSEILCQMEENPSIVNFKDFFMGTALHWAVKRGDEELVRILAKNGTDVDAKSGFTPLHLASIHGKVNIIDILIEECHANVHVRDHSGKKPKDVVKMDSTRELKMKLAKPKAAIALGELSKRFSSISHEDSSNVSGLSKYMEQKDSQKPKSKLKTGASFRFFSKRIKKSDRPVIEHWDSSRQERLQSTLKSDERELYQMQRSNSGSLFPMSFYSTKRKETEGRPGSIEDGGEADGELDTNTPDETRRRLSSRSYPENEFKNLSRISENDVHEPSGDHRNPLGTLGHHLTPDMVNRGTSEGNAISEADSIKRRSFSENNISQRFQDERVDRSAMDMVDRPPGTFGAETELIKREDEEALKLKVDSDLKKEKIDSGGSEDANLKAGLDKRLEEDTLQRDQTSNERGKVNGIIPGFRDAGKRITEEENLEESLTQSFPGGKHDVEEQLSANQEQAAIQEVEKVAARAGYQNEDVIPKFNNNYKQVSEILTSEEQQIGATFEELSPLRPPRKKDKKLKKSPRVDENERNTFNFEAGQPSILTSFVAGEGRSFDGKREFDTATKVSQPDHWNPSNYVESRSGMKDSELYAEPTQSSNPRRNYHLQVEQFDNTERKRDGRVKQHVDMYREFTQGNGRRDQTRRKSDGFAIHRAHSEEDVLLSQLKTRRKSEGFRASLEDFTDHRRSERFSKQKEMSLDHPRRSSTEDFIDRRTSEGFLRQKELSLDHPRGSYTEDFADNQSTEGFSRQREVSLDHPGERYTEDFTDKRRSEGFSSQKEVSLDHPRKSYAEGFTDQQRLEAFSRQKEVSLDHPRRGSKEDFLKIDQEFTRPKSEDLRDKERSNEMQALKHSRPKSEGFTDQTYEPFTDQQRSGSFTNQRRSEGFTSHVDESLDQPRRRTVHSLPPKTTQSKSRHILPDVLSDNTTRRTSSGYQVRPQDDREPTGDDLVGNPPIDQRVPPPYRAPPGLISPSEGVSYPEHSKGRSSSRPNYMAPPPPVSKDSLPNQKSMEFSDYSSKNLSENTHLLSQANHPSSLEVSPKAPPRKHRNSLPSEVYPPTEVSPTAPPRKHRKSLRRSSSESDYHPPPEVSPTAPPRKRRNSLTRALEGTPTGSTQRPNHPPPVLPSNAPPPHPNSPGGEEYILAQTLQPPLPVSSNAPLHPMKSQGGEDFTQMTSTGYLPSCIQSNTPPSHSQFQSGEDYSFRREVSRDQQRRPHNFEPNDPVIVAERSFEPSLYNSQQQSSNYRRSGGNEYNKSEVDNFGEYSRNYQRSGGNEPYLSEYAYNSQQQCCNNPRSLGNEYNKPEVDKFGEYSSNYGRSEGNEGYPSEYPYTQPQSSDYRRSVGNDYYPSAYDKREEQSSVYRLSEDNEYRQTSLPQVSTVSRQNNPSEFIPNFETTAARGEVGSDENYSFRQRMAVDTTAGYQSPPEEVVLARSVPLRSEPYTNYPDEERDAPDYIPTRNQPESRDSGYTIDKRNGTFDHPRFNREFQSVSAPKHAFSETEPVLWPQFQGYTNTSTARPEVNISRPEQDFAESDFIVAKQMPSHDETYEPRLRGSREDMDTLPGPLGQEMRNKWVSNSSDGSNESGENKNYRMTSII